MAPARWAPSSVATSGAAFGVSSSAARVATSTRSSSAASTPASSNASRPAATARSLRRSPSLTWRRSRTPVRWAIHCSVTPAPSAITSLPTTCSGTAIVTEAMAACRAVGASGVSTPGEAEVLRSALGTGGLHRQRRLGLDAVERLAYQVRQHTARSGLDEAGRTTLLERAHHVEPANRPGERLRESLADVVEGLSGDAGVDGDALVAHLGISEDLLERLHRRLHQRRVERACDRQPLGPDAVLLKALLGLVERGERAREHELVGGVVVRDREPGRLGDLLDTRPLARAHREHAARAVLGPLGRFLHEAAAGGHQPKSILGSERVGSHQRRNLPERVAGHQVRLQLLTEDLPAGERGAKDRRLRPERAVVGALEEVLAHLCARELEQVGQVTLDMLFHVVGLAALAWKQQNGSPVGSHA